MKKIENKWSILFVTVFTTIAVIFAAIIIHDSLVRPSTVYSGVSYSSDYKTSDSINNTKNNFDNITQELENNGFIIDDFYDCYAYFSSNVSTIKAVSESPMLSVILEISNDSLSLSMSYSRNSSELISSKEDFNESTQVFFEEDIEFINDYISVLSTSIFQVYGDMSIESEDYARLESGTISV